jgi:hypothetical protein
MLNNSPPPENHAVYEIMCKNTVQAMYDNIIQHMNFACWVTKATDTHSEYVILLLSNAYDSYANALQCYVTRALPV